MQVEPANSQENALSLEPVYFPDGVFIPRHLTPSKIHLTALDKLIAGLTKTIRLEKLHHKLELYSLRASKGARIIGVRDGGKFMVLALYDQHQYNRLKLIKTAGLNHSIVDLDEPGEETANLTQTLKQMNSASGNYWRKGHFINRKAIYFNDLQEEVIHSDQLPLIVSGVAGSGKTLIIIKMLINAWLSGNQRSVYIAPTSNLAQHAQQLFEEQTAQIGAEAPQEKPNTSFFSVQQFIDAHKKEGTELAEPESVIKWLKNYKTKGKYLQKLLTQTDRVLEEFKIISIMPNRDAYLKRGQEQSLSASKDERVACFTLYETFVKQFPKQCQITFPDLQHNEPAYDKVIIDEGQALTIKQLYEITRCALNGQFLVFGDPLQNFHNHISVFPQLKQHICERYRRQDPIIVLPTTYRNPAPVMHFANDVLRIRRLLLRGIDDKCETITLLPPPGDDPEALPVEWLQTIDDNKQQELAILLNQPHSMVITGNEKSRVKADKLFNSPATLFAEYAQGLEAKIVFLYCLFSPELIRRINRALQGINLDEDRVNMPKSGQGTHEFTRDLNRLFTAVTRVAENKGRLIVYMGDNISKHDSQLFFSLLTQSIVKTEPRAIPEAKAEPATREEWNKWIKNLYDSGNDQEAWKTWCKHINNDAEDYNLLVGKPAVPAAPVALPTATSNRPAPGAKHAQNRKAVTQANTPQQSPVAQAGLFKTAPPAKSMLAASGVKTSLTDGEIVYLNGLLRSFTIENISALLKHRKMAQFLFTQFSMAGERPISLYSIILTSQKYTAILISTLLAAPFIACRLFKYSAIIGDLTGTIGTKLKQRKFHDLEKKDSEHVKALVELLDIFIKLQPDLIDFIPLTDFQSSLFDSLIACNQNLLLKIIDRSPDLINYTITYYLVSQNKLEWYINLFKTRTGAAILVRIHNINPHVLNLLHGDVLNKHAKLSKSQPVPLYFWLSTTIKGQDLLKLLLPKIQEGSLNLHQATKTDDPHFNDTSVALWLSAYSSDTFVETDPVYQAKQMSIAYEYTGLSFAGAFKTSKAEEALIQYDFEAESKEILFKLAALFASKNTERLLFDHVNGANQTLFYQIARRPEILDLFSAVLNQRPENYRIFTLERLNQQIISLDDTGTFTQSVLFLLLLDNSDFLGNLFQHNPGIKKSFTAEFLIRPNFIQAEEKVSILRIIATQEKHFSQLLQLDAEVFTPEFAAELFRIHPESNSFSFNSMRHINEDMACLLLQKHPQLLKYFTEKQLYLTLKIDDLTISRDKPRSALPMPKVFHILCRTPASIKILDMLFDANPNLLSKLTFDDLIGKPSSTGSIMFNLCRTSTGYLLLLKILQARPDLSRMIVFSDLIKEEKPDSPAPVYLIETLFCLSVMDNPAILESLLKNPGFVQSVDPEYLLSRAATTVAYLCSTQKGVTMFEELCKHHPSILEKLTRDVFYKRVNSILLNTIFQNLYRFCEADINTGKETILHTLFRLNPALINNTKDDTASIGEQIEKALQIQQSYNASPAFFASLNSQIDGIPESVSKICNDM